MPPELSATPTEFPVKARMAGKRIDAYLSSRFPDFSRSVIQKVIEAGAVLLNGQPVKASTKVRTDDLIRVWLPDLGDDEGFTPEDLPIGIVYEDDSFVVVDKPAGMVTHPGRGNWKGTLVNALQFHFDRLSSVAGEHRPGIVHRLDRDTTGLVIVAKDDAIHNRLASQFEDRTIEKEYLALVYGAPSRDRDFIERPIGFHPTVREKMAVREAQDGGKSAVTFYEVVERFPAGFALVRCKPKTGRTHQIRVHLAQIGHPIVADKMYAGRARLTVADVSGTTAVDGERILIERQALHAHRLRLIHPVTGRPLDLTAPVPADMESALGVLRAGASGPRGPQP